MKKLIFLFLAAAAGYSAKAQSVGIGTNAPNSSAQLDVTSTSKGLLIPRMTTIQRTAITTPASGLMVYDITLSGFYFYNGTSWLPLNSGGGGNSSWVAGGNNIYNSNTGNVGIGISTPTAKLHLNGLMKIDGGQIDIDDNIAQVRLLDGGSPKGFFKLTSSTGDIQVGTYVGANDEGKLQLETKSFPRVTIEPDGNVGVGTINPAYKLDVAGDIKAEGNLRLEDGYIRMNNTTDAKNWQLQYSSSSNRVLFLENGLERFVWQNGGNIGIGGNLPLSGSFPLAKLHIESGQDAGLTSSNNGYVMIGPGSGTNIVIDNNEIVARNGFTTASALYLQNNGGDVISGARLTINKGGEALKIEGNDPAINFFESGTQRSYIWQRDNNLNIGISTTTGRVIVNTNQMLIGTSVGVADEYRLAIGGKVICEELKVKLQSGGWADYVFADDYKLAPLREVEQYILQNKHLANIPAAVQVEANGLEVGDMQRRMMEKIEELTLYVIDLQKQVDSLKSSSK